METILLSLSEEQFQTFIQTSVRKVLNEYYQQNKPEPSDRCELGEAVEITHLSTSKIYKLTHSNRIPFKKFGRKLIFSKKALLAWMEENTRSYAPNEDLMTQRLKNAARKKFK